MDHLSIVTNGVNKKDQAESINSSRQNNMFRLATVTSSYHAGMWRSVIRSPIFVDQLSTTIIKNCNNEDADKVH